MYCVFWRSAACFLMICRLAVFEEGFRSCQWWILARNLQVRGVSWRILLPFGYPEAESDCVVWARLLALWPTRSELLDFASICIIVRLVICANAADDGQFQVSGA